VKCRISQMFAHLWTFYTTLLQFLHSLRFGRKPLNSRRISAPLMFLASRKRIRAQISQKPGLSIAGHAGHIITHPVETRKNTRWQVMWWFARQWVMWRYLAWASSPNDPILVA
jgi:hypothetical protein